MSALRKATSSATVAFLILAVGVAASLVRAQQVNSQARHRLCELAVVSWNERDAIVQTLTEHATLPPGLDLADPSVEALQRAITAGNERRDRERVALLAVQGSRPQC